jgi:hypothetical protein
MLLATDDVHMFLSVFLLPENAFCLSIHAKENLKIGYTATAGTCCDVAAAARVGRDPPGQCSRA